jgi:hypothetical protein
MTIVSMIAHAACWLRGHDPVPRLTRHGFPVEAHCRRCREPVSDCFRMGA